MRLAVPILQNIFFTSAKNLMEFTKRQTVCGFLKNEFTKRQTVCGFFVQKPKTPTVTFLYVLQNLTAERSAAAAAAAPRLRRAARIVLLVAPLPLPQENKITPILNAKTSDCPHVFEKKTSKNLFFEKKNVRYNAGFSKTRILCDLTSSALNLLCAYSRCSSCCAYCCSSL